MKNTLATEVEEKKGNYTAALAASECKFLAAFSGSLGRHCLLMLGP